MLEKPSDGKSPITKGENSLFSTEPINSLSHVCDIYGGLWHEQDVSCNLLSHWGCGVVCYSSWTTLLQISIDSISHFLSCKIYSKYKILGNSLMAQWLGLSAFIAGARVQSLVGEIRSCKYHMARPKNNNNK